jgi:hypothetical protein
MPLNNETFGVSAKIALCELFNLDYDHAKFNLRVDNNAFEVLTKVFRSNSEIKKLKLNSFLDNSGEFNDQFISRSPHNFTNELGQTISVWTFMNNNPKPCPKVAGQPGVEKANKLFGHLYHKEIDKVTFKELVINKTQDLLDIYFDYLFISDISIFVYLKESSSDLYNPNDYEVKIIDSKTLGNIEFTQSNISFTNSVDQWNESNTVRLNQKSIGEFQVHTASNRFIKFRFFLKNLIEFVEFKNRNNETLGATTEYVICNYFKLEVPPSANLALRADKALVKVITPTVISAFNELPKAITYVGAEGGSRQGSKSSVDFILDGNKTLSLKTNTSKSNKVCPPEIGQPSFKTFDHYFADSGFYIPPINEQKFKEMVMQNPDFLFFEYIDKLFDCDELLWIYGENSALTSFNYKVVSSNQIDSNLDVFRIKDRYSFTRSLADWNESNTLKYNDVSIGEFQVHSARSSLKFRFNYFNLIEMLKLDSKK